MAPLTKEEIEQKRAEAMAARSGDAGPGTPGSAPAPRAGRPQYENRSRLGLATPAIRPGMKGRILLAGPSGSGKTYTSLLIAMVLRERTDIMSVLLVDTEKDSGRTYADEFVLPDGSPAYKHLPWAPPYDPTDLAMTLRDASGAYDAVIIDSHSHFWRGAGGVLDVAGGRWTGWKEARPMHADMIDAILSCDCHIILCARMKQAHEQVRDERSGKLEVRKLGMEIQQDADLEYEVNVALEMDMNHTLRVTKSRTRAVPVGREFIAGHAEELAGMYREWLKGGEPAASKEQLDNLIGVLNRIEDPANRMQAKQRFQETFGRPEMLLQSRVMEAAEWVANALLGNEPPPDRAPDEVPPEPKEGEEQAATGPPAASRGESGPPAQPASGEQESSAPAESSPSPASEAETGQAGTAESAAEAEAPAGPEGPEVFNGDTGHCATCGAPIWRDLDLWKHTDEEPVTLDHTPEPAGPEVDADALYERAVAQHAGRRVARVKAAVGQLSSVELIQALQAAGIQPAGGPKKQKELLEAHLLSLPEEEPSSAAAG